MKKKIFITGAVREFDSGNPTIFVSRIESYIHEFLLSNDVELGISATVIDNTTLVIRMPFTAGNEVIPGTVSRELYRCFTGEHSGFRAEHSLWWTFSFGSAFPMNVRIDSDEIVKAHKKNTLFYKADSYKSLQITEDKSGLTVTIVF